MRDHKSFTAHFVICLAVAAVAFFAWTQGVIQTIYRNDMSMATSVIAALFVGTAVYLGWQAWNIDYARTPFELNASGLDDGEFKAAMRAREVNADYGHLAERLSVMAGFVGTAIGLSLQAKALAGGSTSFTALATSLFTTACGGVAAAVIAIMTYSLECGIRRSRR